MQLVKGKYNQAQVYASIVEQEALNQIQELCDQDWAQGSHIAIMPDTHAGAGCTIGTSMTLTDKVCPNLVGVDIGCGMLVVELGDIDINMAQLDRVINSSIPSGMNVNDYQVADFDLDQFKADLYNRQYLLNSIGTLGGGNHFIEVDIDPKGNKYLVIHTGSRNLGVQICKWYMVKATDTKPRVKAQVDALVKEYKAKGKVQEIQQAIQKLKSQMDVQKGGLAYVEGEDFENYLHDMELAQQYAQLNRAIIAQRICLFMDWHPQRSWETIHNYIDMENGILRKGAVSAQLGELLLIPMNMRDGSLVCVGKGNEDWNCTAPHGAGRLMSRAKAKQNLSMDKFQEEMKNIFSTSVCEQTLDESPMAYKPMDIICQDIADTVEIIDVIKPIYNFKAKD